MKAALEPPRDTGLSLEAMSTTSQPSSVAAMAVMRPEVPAPTTIQSAVTVSPISDSSMGSGAISNDHLAFS